MKKRYLIIFSILVILILIFSGCSTNQKNSNENNNDGNNSIAFNYPHFDLEKVYYILPMGGMTGAHVTPIDHQYYISYNYGSEEASNIDVYSPSDGIVTSIQHMDIAAGDSPFPVDDFRLTIQHTSTIYSYYIHVDELSKKLSTIDPGLGKYASVNVEVSAGEIIGRYSGSVDYNIVDENVNLSFINPTSYMGEPWKIHCPDPFDYFNDEIKNQMIGKCLRTEEPIGGKICYDIDGRLVGTWFEEGTNGYGGVDPNRYWAGHLSIVYDSIDPDAIIISIGRFIDTAQQFAVKNNSPDPADISVDDRLVIYELVDYEYYKNDIIWDRESLVQGLKIKEGKSPRGTILLQMLGQQKLKVEIFPNETSEILTSFTKNAKIYVR
ncbi:MAG: hypothetical protein JSV67_03415 [Thermoplasmatales archaeon]|nr:MAG: hypothetical protein JSV67_03415 [Thermoplasmatales archaeon]